ncbi:MAG: class B sortase [Clostridia bacterium]|nr:class B sortase [Clostridia bacterium]
MAGQSNRDLSKRLKTKVLRNGILFVVFFFLFIFSLVNLIRWGIYNGKAESLKAKLIKTSFKETLKKDEDLLINPVDFKSLTDINTDTVAWLKIPGTSIDYPVLQTTDNDYYLHKDFNRKYNTCGWIFMDYKNNSKMIDKNTVIYGHNIKSGIMFADLQKVQSNELGEEVLIELYTPLKKMIYRVFSSYMAKPDNYAIKSNIVDDDTQEKYIEEMLERSDIEYNVVPDKTDQLLTLSTCDKSGRKRILVHSVCIKSEKFNNN